MYDTPTRHNFSQRDEDDGIVQMIRNSERIQDYEFTKDSDRKSL
jgi:hypothetical protein